MRNHYVIGIDAGGTKVAYGLFGESGELLDRMQHPTDICAGGEAFSDTVAENIMALLSRNSLNEADLDGVGICMPSFILFDEGRILMTSAMPGIKDFPMRDYLAERIHTRIVLDNDSKRIDQVFAFIESGLNSLDLPSLPNAPANLQAQFAKVKGALASNRLTAIDELQTLFNDLLLLANNLE